MATQNYASLLVKGTSITEEQLQSLLKTQSRDGRNLREAM